MSNSNDPTCEPVPSRPASAETDSGLPIRPRALVVGFVLAMAICAVTPFNNVYRGATPLGGGHFPLAPFYILVWLTVLMAAARAVFRKSTWLTGRELLIAWILMVLVSGIAYTGFARTFFINLTAPFHFATVGNRWEEVLQPLLPRMLYPQEPEAISMFYDGFIGGRQMNWWQVFSRIPWSAWVVPLLCWGVFILASYFVMLCLINLLNRQAIRNERMNFPLLRVPQLLEEAFDEHALGAFLTNRFLLAGLAVPIVLHLINGLNFYFPSVPQIPTLILAGPYFPKYGLFSGFYKLKIYIYPAFIGFAFLASKQISLSFWLFYILGGLLFGLLSMIGYDIPSAALGVTFGPTLARPEEMQVIGAYAVFFAFLFWLARHHLLNVVKDAFRPGQTTSSETEWMSYRFSFWGLVIGTLFILLWCHYFGLSVWTSLFVIAAFFMVMLVASRVICQGGIAYFTLTAAPLDGLLLIFGPRFFSHVGILLAGVMQKVLFVDLRESLMPSLLHAGKVTHRMNPRKMILVTIMLTLAGGLVVSTVAMLTLCYKYGVRELQLDWATRTTVTVYDNIQTLVETPLRSGDWVTVFAIAGAVVMLGLVICYHQFYWWPIHPIGYLTTYSSAMPYLWFAFFLGWLCNVLCMRYGGVMLFRKLRFFFIGLIIGDFFMGGTWAIIGMFSDASYLVLPS
jgi:hypothetical protein